MIFAVPLAAMAMQLLRAVGTRLVSSALVRTAGRAAASSVNRRVAKAVAKRAANAAKKTATAVVKNAGTAAVEAAQKVPQRGVSFDVLEDTTLTNARQVSAALDGGATRKASQSAATASSAPATSSASPTATLADFIPKSPTASQPAPAAPPSAPAATTQPVASPTPTAPAAPQPASGATPVTPAAAPQSAPVAAPAASVSSPAPPAVTPQPAASSPPAGAATPPTPAAATKSPPAGSPAATPGTPAASQPAAGADSIWDRIADRMQRMREHVAQKIYDRVPVSDRVRGLTMDERFERLQQNNMLKPMSEVAKEAATPNPSREQQVRSSEAAEEQARQDRLNPKEQQQKEAGKSMLLRMSGMASGLGTIIAPHLPAEAIKIFAERISMANRHLEQWNASIASSYAQLDLKRMRLDFKTASETSGSTSALNESLERLMDELQPFRAATISALNVIAKAVVEVGIIVAQIAKWSPIFWLAAKKLAEIEENTRKEHEAAQTPVSDFMRRTMEGGFVRPLNPTPRAPNRPGRM